MDENDQRHRLPATRRSQVATLVEERGEATVAELADALGVSADTVRRDLDELARRGILTRTHGGAMHRQLARADRPFENRLRERHEVKEAIGRATAKLVDDNQTLLINGGTTTLAVARALRDSRDLTIVTNNLRIPAEIDTACVRELYLLGGNCRFSSLVTVGPVEFPGTLPDRSHAVMADVAIIGVGGISARSGLSTSNLHEARMMREMMDAADRVIVVADSTKFERNAFAQIADLHRAHTVVTDTQPPTPLAEALEEAGVDLVVAT
jgi:DeoR family transcriptional regulator, fructose operon transcriptional repressor